MRSIINKIVLLLVLFVTNSCVEPTVNHEPKYRNHQSYAEFIEYLRTETDLINEEYEKISLIRKRTSELIDGGAGGRDASLLDAQWPDWEGNRYYDMFFNDSATVKCGGSAHFLQKVYADLGYKSDTYDIGCPGFYTHQTTLVQHPQNKQFYIQDAFFNSDFSDNNGNALAFPKLISLLYKHKIDSIKFTQRSFDYLPDFDTTGMAAIINSKQYARTIVDSIQTQLKNNQKVSRYEMAEIGFYIRCLNSPCFKARNLPEEFIYLYLFPLEHNSKRVFKIYEEALLDD